MSVVSGVTVLCSCAEDEGEIAVTLNAIVGREVFADLSDAYLGGKHPQCCVFGAGLNYFDEDAFAAAALALPWAYPENVVIVIQPEEGRTRVWTIEAKSGD